MDKLLLTVDDVCDILSIKKSKVYAMIKDGTIPSVRIGEKTVRVPTQGLRDWLAVQCDDGDGHGGAPS